MEQCSEIEKFLHDVREHFKASLETSEYENSSNLFHVTEAEATAKLLYRCETLLQKLSRNKNPQQQQQHQLQLQQHKIINNAAQMLGNEVSAMHKLNVPSSHTIETSSEPEVSYLDMTANYKKQSSSSEYMDCHNSTDSDKIFACSSRLPDICGSINDDDAEDADGDGEIYDTLQVSQYCLDTQEIVSIQNDCPFLRLPAGHLAIQKSSKYGQLQRIEKRLFFDQTKKYFCGILNDWLLCYADGPTGSCPTMTLYLKSPATEIEHSGEGKRRDICFQITTSDPNKKLVFQANNEVEAKEWIHAIESVIRSDTKETRRLPTPPVMKKLTFVDSSNESNNQKQNTATTTAQNHIDSIYEEPGPIYKAQCISKESLFSEHSSEFAYDIPKSPPKPIEQEKEQKTENSKMKNSSSNIEPENLSLLVVSNGEQEKSLSNSQKIRSSIADLADKIDFQSKVKDLHSKLSSQLLATSPYQDRLQKKTVRKTYSNSSNDSAESVALTSSPTAKDQKKQKTSNTPQASPQKSNSISNSNNNNNNNNNNTSEKIPKNWFLNRFHKTTSSIRSNNSTTTPTFAKCRQSEKENLLDNPPENVECPSSPILKTDHTKNSDCTDGNKSKVNMIINQFETSGSHIAMFSLAAISMDRKKFSDCNNYEPIVTLSPPPPSSLMKKA